MLKKKSRDYWMVAQVVNFGVKHPEFFKEGSEAAGRLARLQSAQATMSSYATSHYTGTGAVLASRGIRFAARSALLEQIAAIHQTAGGMGLTEFWLPRSCSDAVLYDAGKSFKEKAELIKDEFIAHGLPSGFLEELQVTVEDMATALENVKDGHSVRTKAMAGFDTVMKEAKADLKVLKTIMTNLLRNDPVNRAAWGVILRVDKTGGKRGPRKSAAPATVKTSDTPKAESGVIALPGS